MSLLGVAAALSTVAAALGDATPPRWARRGRNGAPVACLGCRQAWVLARRSDSPFSAKVCEPCSSRSMMASAMVGSLSH